MQYCHVISDQSRILIELWKVSSWWNCSLIHHQEDGSCIKKFEEIELFINSFDLLMGYVNYFQTAKEADKMDDILTESNISNELIVGN